MCRGAFKPQKTSLTGGISYNFKQHFVVICHSLMSSEHDGLNQMLMITVRAFLSSNFGQKL